MGVLVGGGEGGGGWFGFLTGGARGGGADGCNLLSPLEWVNGRLQNRGFLWCPGVVGGEAGGGGGGRERCRVLSSGSGGVEGGGGGGGLVWGPAPHPSRLGGGAFFWGALGVGVSVVFVALILSRLFPFWLGDAGGGRGTKTADLGESPLTRPGTQGLSSSGASGVGVFMYRNALGSRGAHRVGARQAGSFCGLGRGCLNCRKR